MSDKTILDLPNAAEPDPTIMFEIVQGGVSAKLSGEQVLRIPFVVTTQNGPAYTLQATDTYVRCNNAGAFTVTVPDNASVPILPGRSILLFQVGAGQVTLAAGAGVTLNTPETLNAAKQFATIVVTKVDTDEWDVAGNLEGA